MTLSNRKIDGIRRSLVRRIYVRRVLIWTIGLMCFYSVHAERLPVKTYTVADGLAHSRIQQIFQDAKGFLWLATGEGLSRFDGYGFTSPETRRRNLFCAIQPERFGWRTEEISGGCETESLKK